MRDILKNYVFSMGYQLLLIGTSLILGPYLSRVVGAEGIGIYSYTYSIASIFGIAAHLGISKYGNREIAKCGDNRKKRSEVFAQILFIKLLCAALVLLLYCLFLQFMAHEYKTAFCLQIFLILSYMLDVTWVFWGLEQFQFTTVICSVVKVLSVIAVLLFVHDRGDVSLYIFFMSFSFLLVQLIPWFFLPRFVDIKICFKAALKKHGKSILLLFFPVLASRIYGIMDMVMLEHFTDLEQVGYYQNAISIVTTVVCVITALGEVIMPKITIYIHEKRSKEALKIFYISFHLISFLGIGSMYGLIGVAAVFIPFFYGSDFTACIFLLQLIAPHVLFSGYSELVRSCFLLPNYQDKEYVITLAAGVITNFFGNFIFIQLMGTSGAILASVMADFVSLLFLLYFTRTNFPFAYCIKKMAVYLLLGLPILLGCKFVNSLQFAYLSAIAIDILFGGGLYIILVILYLRKTEPDVYHSVFRFIHKNRN